jgi:hypothetical protein
VVSLIFVWLDAIVGEEIWAERLTWVGDGFARVVREVWEFEEDTELGCYDEFEELTGWLFG